MVQEAGWLALGESLISATAWLAIHQMQDDIQYTSDIYEITTLWCRPLPFTYGTFLLLSLFTIIFNSWLGFLFRKCHTRIPATYRHIYMSISEEMCVWEWPEEMFLFSFHSIHFVKCKIVPYSIRYCFKWQWGKKSFCHFVLLLCLLFCFPSLKFLLKNSHSLFIVVMKTEIKIESTTKYITNGFNKDNV